MTISLLDLPEMVMCFIFSIAIFTHVVKTWKKEGKDIYKKINEIVTGLLLIALGLYYPLYVQKFGDNLSGIVLPSLKQEFSIIGLFGIIGVMIGICIWGISNKIKSIRHPELLENVYNYEVFSERLLKEYRLVLKRKITHVLPFGVIGGLILIFYVLQFIPIFSDKWQNYALFFIVILGIDFALTFLVGDLIRLFDYSFMPPPIGELFIKGLTPDELDTFASTSIMVFGFAPFLLFEFPLFLIIALITSIGDGMASIFGIIATNKNFKHEFPKGSHKSIEGYIGGFIFTFLCVIFGGLFSNFFGFSDPTVWSMELLVILGIILSIIVFLIDIITSKNIKLCDNYLIPLICGLVAIIVLVIMRVPF